MATFFVNQSDVTVTGTPADDQFFIESGVQDIDLQGLGGNDEFLYFFGSVNSSFNFGNSNVNANGGDDTIRVKLNSGSDIFASQFRGGLDNDSIVVTAVSAASGNLPTFAGNLLQGGQGNDTIKLKIESSQYNNLTLNGNEGADFIRLSATADVTNRVNNINLFGGKGNDQINIDIGGSGASDFSVAGGLGADRLQLQFATARITNLVVNGGTFGTLAVADEGDDIFISAKEIAGQNSVVGNGGDDTIRIVSDTAANLLMAGNAGDDTLIFSANAAKNVTIGGGNGADLIEIRQSAGVFNTANGGRNSLIGGNGDDTIFIKSGSNLSGATVTIQGGGGADLFFVGSSADTDQSALDQISGGNFSYASLTDSTIDALDTIVIGSGGTANNNSGAILNMFMPNAVTVNAFNGQAGGFQFTAGVLEMDTAAGSGGNISLSQIVGTLDATLSEGDAVAFRLGTADTEGFVFVAGANAGVKDDLLVRIEGFNSAGMSGGDATLTNGGANSLVLDLQG
jgi:hypothetical protein